MGMRFKLSAELFFSRFLLNLLIVLQLCAVLVFGNTVIAQQNARLFGCELLRNAPSHTYYYMPAQKDVYEDASSAICRFADRLSVSRCENYDVGLPDDTDVRVIGYGGVASDLLRSQLVAGQWFTDAPEEEEIRNCVIAGDREKYPIGTVIEARGYAGTTMVDGIPYDEMRPLAFRVCGYVGGALGRVEIMEMKTASDEMTADLLFTEYQTQATGLFDTVYMAGRNQASGTVPLILLCEDTLEGIVSYGSDNAMISVSGDLTDTEREDLLAELRKEARVRSVDEIRTYSEQVAKEERLPLLPIFLCFAAMGALGVVSVSVMTMMRNRMVFKVYIHSGMRKRDGFLLLCGNLLILLLLTAALSFGIWLLLLRARTLPWYHMRLCGNNLLFTVLCAVVTAAGMLGIEGMILNGYYRLEESGIC